jgi:hypothetical protein
LRLHHRYAWIWFPVGRVSGLFRILVLCSEAAGGIAFGFISKVSFTAVAERLEFDHHLKCPDPLRISILKCFEVLRNVDSLG